MEKESRKEEKEGKAGEKAEEKKKSPFSMTKEEVNELPVGGFKGKISIICSVHAAEKAAKFLSEHDVLGFDTESKPCFKKGESSPIALIQLATDRRAFLFRVNVTGMLPPLKRILEDEKILKIGQGLKYELRSMKKELGVTGRGFVDLLDIAFKLDCEPKSVKGMSALFLGFRIVKSMQVTNWEREWLSEKQLRYAATDAWACLKVYEAIKRRKLVKAPHKTKHR